MRGENQERDGDLPELQYVYEHLIAKYYGWTIKEIRNLDYYDFQVHLRLCLVSDGIDREFKVMLAGGTGRGSTQKDTQSEKKQIKKEFDSETGQFKDKAKQPDKVYQKYDPKKGMLL